jgi:plasmid stability protein
MEHLTIHNLDENIKARLEKQAKEHGRSLEEEAKEILRHALTEQENPLNLATMIERRFAPFGDFELPEISREPMRQIPAFDE